MPRRILLLLTDLQIGGTPTVVRELAVRLHHPPDVEIEVACLKKWGPVADQLRQQNIRVTAFDAARATQLPSIVGKLRRLIRQHEIDIVVSFLIHANLVAAVSARKLPGVRFIQSIQTTQPNPRWHWKVQRWAAGKAERIVVPSPSVADVAREWSGIVGDRIVVIPNAIDPGAFSLSPALRENPTPFPIGFIGRLDPVKRLPDLIEATKLLAGRVHLHLFGDGSERDRIAALASDHITVHGTIERPAEALARIGLLVLPSQAEGFGLVLIEAMAAGVPVVATDVPGIRDVVQSESNGLLVPVANPAMLSQAIARVLDDQDLRTRLIAAGRQTVREKYTWDIVLPQYRRLIGE